MEHKYCRLCEHYVYDFMNGDTCKVTNLKPSLIDECKEAMEAFEFKERGIPIPPKKKDAKAKPVKAKPVKEVISDEEAYKNRINIAKNNVVVLSYIVLVFLWEVSCFFSGGSYGFYLTGMNLVALFGLLGKKGGTYAGLIGLNALLIYGVFMSDLAMNDYRQRLIYFAAGMVVLGSIHAFYFRNRSITVADAFKSHLNPNRPVLLIIVILCLVTYDAVIFFVEGSRAIYIASLYGLILMANLFKAGMKSRPTVTIIFFGSLVIVLKMVILDYSMLNIIDFVLSLIVPLTGVYYWYTQKKNRTGYWYGLFLKHVIRIINLNFSF